MSNNIKDTDTNKIRLECDMMINDIFKLSEQELESKYEYLFKTSKGLFKFILKEHNSSIFNKEMFDKKLNTMLSMIQNIQNNKISQHEASTKIGTSLAEEYIPTEFLEKK